MPAIFIAVTLAFTLILPPAKNESSREMNPWTYPPPNEIFFSDRTLKKGGNTEHLAVMDELMGPIGMGTACLKQTECVENHIFKGSMHGYVHSYFWMQVLQLVLSGKLDK